MKKHLLLGIATVIGSIALAQNSSSVHSSITPQKINPALSNLAMPIPKLQLGGANSFESIVYGLQQNPNQNHAKSWGPAVQIGTTTYQLQTNSSVCNRIVRPTDSTISATWTMSQTTTAGWPDRGTGYTYYDGSAWSFGTTGPTTRVESLRTGFTNVGYTSTGKEIIVCHEAPASGLGNIHVDSRNTIGSGTWTESALGFSDVWARMSVGGANGQTVHVISSSGLDAAGTTLVNFHGQTGAITYSRSQDGGVTWDKLRTIIPCLDSSHYVGFGGDSYSIDAKGDTIAIVAGGFDVDVVLAKSVDNGNSWTSTVVKRFAIPMYNQATMVTDSIDPTGATGTVDTLISNDASVEVLLDNNGMAHVFYGRMRVTESSGGTAMSYFPGTDGLMYWDENMGIAGTAPVMIAAVKDLNGNGTIDVDFCANTTCTGLGFGTYGVSLTSQPSAGTDAAGHLFLSYASIYEGTNEQGTDPYTVGAFAGEISGVPGKSYRHTYLMRSDDNGATWCPPIDITNPGTDFTASNQYDFYEGVYGAVAKHNNSFVHLINQQDGSPGHGVGGTATSPDPQGNPADIMYYKIPVTDLACGMGINEYKTQSSIDLFPNPATNSFNLKFNLSRISKGMIQIYNAMGQEVTKIDNQSISNGTVITISLANYKSGIYFVNSVIDGKTYSHKLIVQ